MKFKYINLPLFLMASSVASAATTQFDTDGLGRYTHYNDGVVYQATTGSRAVSDLEVYIYRRDESTTCDAAGLYNANTSEFIAPATVYPIHQARTLDQVVGSIPREAFEITKLVKVSCTAADGSEYVIQHKIAPVPEIKWEATLSPNGNYVDGGAQWYGHHALAAYNGRLSVVNSTSDSGCAVTHSSSNYLPIFNGSGATHSFHSDVFTGELVAGNNEGLPFFSQHIECWNPAGTTKAVKVWDMTDENNIVLNQDYVEYR